MNVVVVGGGWAGLATAIKLASHKIPVKVLEAETQLGGRTRCVEFNGVAVDNGQQILFGNYHETLATLNAIGIDLNEAFYRVPFTLYRHKLSKTQKIVTGAHLPAPLHLIAALVRTRYLSLTERISAVRFCFRMRRYGFRVKDEVTAEALLIRHRQKGNIARYLWEPICETVLKTPLKTASAQLFVNALRDLFFSTREESDILFPRQSLCQLFTKPATEYIENQGGSVLLRKPATALRIQGGRVVGVESADEFFPATHVVLAIPASNAADLLHGYQPTARLAQDLKQIGYEPCHSLYLQFPEDVTSAEPWLQIESDSVRWLFDRRLVAQPGLMACNIHLTRELQNLDQKQQTDALVAEFKHAFPGWPSPSHQLLIHEHHAAMSATLENERLRPEASIALQGCFLAGDYVKTNLAANLESAVHSGLVVANHLINAPK